MPQGKKLHTKPDRAIIWVLLTNRLLAQLGEFAGLVVYFGLQIAKLSAQIAAQAIQITAKDGEIRVLRDELTALKARMSKDSHNSSKLPSTDGLHKKTKTLRSPSSRPTGGQKGHKGSTLEWVQKPTRMVICSLPEICDHCGKTVQHVSTRIVEKGR